jgi:hypothetical protein
MPAKEGFRYDPSFNKEDVARGEGGTISLPTPLPMSVDPSTGAEINGTADYKHSVNGVIPGYAGHMPRARDKYAGSAHGGIANPYTPPDAKGPQKGCTRPEDVIPDEFTQFIKDRKGAMAGYTGFRPGARDVHNVTAFTGIPNSFEEGAHERSFDWQRAPQDPPPSFRDSVGGILPGYKGFVPGAIEKHGTSHYGKTRPSPERPTIPLIQAGHEEQELFSECKAPFMTMPGYQGHIPMARDAFGQSYHGKRVGPGREGSLQ